MEAGKAIGLVAALALGGCSLPKCEPTHTVMPCNAGFYHAQDWDNAGWLPDRPPLKFRAKLAGGAY